MEKTTIEKEIVTLTKNKRTYLLTRRKTILDDGSFINIMTDYKEIK